MTSAWYQVLVVGDDLGSVAFAALAARAGYRVGVLGQGGRSNTYRHEGHLFVRQAPPLVGLAASPIVSKALASAGLRLSPQQRPLTVNPTLQVVGPDLRLDVVGHAQRWERELRREVGLDAPGVLALERWAREQARASDAAWGEGHAVPPVGHRAVTQHRALARDVECLGLAERGARPGALREAGAGEAIIEGVVSCLSDVATSGGSRGGVSATALARLWTQLRAGLLRFPRGLDGLRQRFLHRLADQSGDYRRDDAAAQILFRRDRAREVALAGRRERLGCDVLVLGGAVRQRLDLVGARDRDARYHADMEHIEVAGWRVGLNIALDPAGLPVGMGPEVVLLPGERGPAGRREAPLWISRPGVPHREGAGLEGTPGPGVLHVTMVADQGPTGPTASLIRAAAARALERLRGLIPWFDDHLLALDIPALRGPAVVPGVTARGGGVGARAGADADGLVDPEVIRPLYAAPLPQTFGVGAYPVTTAYRNVLLVGDGPMAGLGLEGTFLTARQAVALTAQIFPLRRSV